MSRLVETPNLWCYGDGEVNAMLTVVARPCTSLDLLRAERTICHEADRSEVTPTQDVGDFARRC
jgi:hypothetical protein